MSVDSKRDTKSVGSNSEILNVQVLKDLIALDEPGQEPILQSLVKMFLNNFPRNLQEMQQALDTGDLNLIRRRAHTMRSSCGNLGANGLVRLCADIEKLDDKTPPTDAKILLTQLGSEFEKVKVALSEYI